MKENWNFWSYGWRKKIVVSWDPAEIPKLTVYKSVQKIMGPLQGFERSGDPEAHYLATADGLKLLIT